MPGEPAAPATGPRRPGALALVAVVLIVVLAVVAIISLVQRSDSNGQLATQRALEASAVAAASTDARDVATYDYRHLNTDFGKVEGESTPKFRSGFVKSSDGLRKILTQYDATAQGKVLAAGVVSVTSTKAVVLVFLDQTVTNTAQKQPSTDNSRMKVTLVRSDTTWKLDALKLL
jgi:Mce-associated membrane protein